MEKQLSPQANAIVGSVNEQPLDQQQLGTSLTSVKLASKIAQRAASASPEALVKASTVAATSMTCPMITDAPATAAGVFTTVFDQPSKTTFTAVAGAITVKAVTKRQFDTLLSESSFNLSSLSQDGHADRLGYRVATRVENLVYVESLLEREDAGTINDADKNALKTYRERSVRDDRGRISVVGRNVRTVDTYWGSRPSPKRGALFVRPS